MEATRRSISYWHDSLPEGELDTLRPALPGDIEADVAIVGGGFTGLWTAYYLAQRDPSLRIVVLEKDFAGFGASGRNGGWASAFLPTSWEAVAKESSRDEALRMQRAANSAVDVVGKVAADEGHRRPLRQGRLPAPRHLSASVGPAAAAARPRPRVGPDRGGRRPA